MEIDTYEDGVPNWVDLGTSDIDKAAACYTALFGWDVVDAGPDAGGYRIAHLRGKPVAGLGPQMNPGPPMWTTYIKVSDADAITEKVGALGGKVLMPPMDVFDMGRMAVFMDPTGAAFSIWQPIKFPGSAIVNETGTFAWNELITTDVDAAKAFYSALFGWQPETHQMGPMSYTEWKIGGRSVGGMMAKMPDMPAQMPSLWTVYFLVNDCDAAAAKVKELGGNVMREPMDIEPGRFAVLADPTGAVFCVMKLKEAAG